jgi:hypothetical protein
VAIAVEDAQALVAALHAAAADLAGLSWDDVPVEIADAVVGGIESEQRTLSTVSYAVVDQLRADPTLRRGRRLRDHLANLLHISAIEAGTRIATAADFAGDRPNLPETATASRYGLIGSEHVRIIRDTLAKLPDNADPAAPISISSWPVSRSPSVPRCSGARLRSCSRSTTQSRTIRSRGSAAAPPVVNSYLVRRTLTA